MLHNNGNFWRLSFKHFPRVFPKSDKPVPLPDFGFDIVPQFCPLYGFDGGTNIHDIISLILLLAILVAACNKPAPEGRLALQQLLHLMGMIFLMRTTTVSVTGLPQPNPRCVPIQSTYYSFSEAIIFVFRKVIPHACGDLVFSGHIAFIFTCLVILHRRRLLWGTLPYILMWILAFGAIFSAIACRSHYSLDVVLALYFAYFTQFWYFSLCSPYAMNIYPKTDVKFIAWMEDRILPQNYK